MTGFALGAVAVAYLLGNRRAGRRAHDAARGRCSPAASAPRRRRADLGPHGGVAVTLVLFALAAAMVATRMVAATVYGFTVAGELGREVGVVRAVTTQLGYLIGSLAGGAAYALAGFAVLAVVFGGLFLASTLPYAALRAARTKVVLAEGARP